MLLTIRTTHEPATDLGYLLHKHPEKVQEFNIAFGNAHVFYPEANEKGCTFAMYVEVDPVRLVRGKPDTRGPGILSDYVNDRPYAASSMMAVAMGHVLRSAINGRCESHAALAETPLPLEMTVAAVRTACGHERIERLFTALEYEISIEQVEDDPKHAVLRVKSSAHTLAAALSHVYVLMPAIDGNKHHYVTSNDVDQLLKRGEGWLAEHPDRNWISSKFLNRQRTLANEAVDRLEGREGDSGEEKTLLPHRETLQKSRIETVAQRLIEAGAKRVVDLGCGEGSLAILLAGEPQIERVVGLDIAVMRLERARRRAGKQLDPDAREKIQWLKGPLGCHDPRWEDCESAALVETIEHIDPDRLEEIERTVLAKKNLKTLIVTTPNREYNVNYEGVGEERLRHGDHRFEWSREEMQEWSNRMAEKYEWKVQMEGIGDLDPDRGTPTQMAVFQR